MKSSGLYNAAIQIALLLACAPSTAAEPRENAGTAISRWATPGNAEFVILFAPSGVVAKTRIRPAPAPVEAKGT